MTSTEARQAHAAALANRSKLVSVAQGLSGRKATAAWRAVEMADLDLTFAQREVEMATRREMAGATEAQIQAAALAA